MFSQSGSCDGVTPFYVVDLTGNPNGTWVSPPDQRDGHCCGNNTGNDKCIEFELTLDPGTAAISFDIVSGAVPSGALFYQLNCGPPTAVGQPICVSGVGPHTITFCKPGNNQNVYAINAIPAPGVSPNDTIGNGCDITIGSVGIQLTGITWTTVGPGPIGQYNNFLSCLSGCDSTVVTPVAPYPPYIDIQICGVPVAIDCYPNPNYCDTIRLTLLDPVQVTLGPNPAVYCVSDPGIALTSTVTGGVPPYNFVWYGPTGNVIASTQNAFATAPGPYTFEVQDANYPGCPSFAETMVVTTQPLPLVEAGGPFEICPSEATVNFSGTVTGATGLTWSASGGTFTPGPITTSGNYEATPGEVGSGSFYLYASSLGNGYCPAVTDSLLVTVTDPVEAIISGDTIVCSGATTTLSASGTGGVGPYTYLWSTGANAPSIDVGAGTYSLTVTDASTYACSGTVTFTVVENPVMDIIVPTAPIITCDSTALVTISATGGNGNYTFLWSNGLVGNTVTVNTGTYYVTATDDLGCSVTESVQVTASNSALEAEIDPPATVCFGQSANFNATASGGFPPYTYDWTNGDVTATSSGMAGQYCVTVEDTLGCLFTACVIVNQAPPLTLYLPAVDPVCYGGTTWVVAQALGGTPPYTYQWSTGSFNDSILVGGGSYTVTVIDANANQCSVSGDITVGEADPIQIAFTSTPVSCNGGANGTATATVTGGFPNYVYNWSNGAVTATANGLSANTSYVLNITDLEGCTGVSAIALTEPTPVVATIIDSSAVSCYGGSNGTATAMATGGTAPYSYSWFTSAGSSLSQFGISATNLPAGQYYVLVTDAHGCTVTSALTTITQPTAVTASVTANPVTCFGLCNGTAQVVAGGGNGGYVYSWNDPLTQHSATAQNLCSGSYTVLVTDMLGCQMIASGTVTQPTPLTLNNTVVNANCFQADGQGCVTASGGTGPYQYFWPNSFQGSCQMGLFANSYVVTATDANGCSQQIAVDVQNVPGPVAGIINAQDVSCFGVCDGSATVGIVGGSSGPFTVQWDAGTGSQISPTASNLCAGIYGVQITDTNGCSASTSVTIVEPPILLVNTTSTDPLCNNSCNGTAYVDVVGGTTTYAYQWVNSTGITIGNNDSIANLCAGTYSILVTDAHGCQEGETFILDNPPLLTGSSTIQNVSCFGSCDGQMSVTPLGGTSPYTVSWGTNAGNQQTPTAYGLCNGAYTATVTDFNGCTVLVNNVVSQPAQIQIGILNMQDVLCYGQCNGFIEVLASGGQAPYQYNWSNGMTGSMAQNLCVGTYCVTVTDVNGCSEILCVDVTQPSPLQANLTTVNVSCFGACNGEALAQPSGGTGPYSYSWSNGGQTSYVNGLCNGIYTVQVSDQHGCIKNGVVSIAQPNDLQINLVSSADANCTQNNGEICVNVTGGSGSISLQWLDPNLQVTNCAYNLFAGCYGLEVTDGNGCAKDTTFCINDVAGPTIGLTQLDNATCNGLANGTIVTSASGSTMPLTINWYDGGGNSLGGFSNQQIVTGLAADCYRIEVIDGAGCAAAEVYCVSEPQAITSFVNQIVHNSCFQSCDGEAGVYVTGGTAPYTYSWSQGNNVTSSYNTGLCAGNIGLTITDDHGCSIQRNVVINQPAELTLATLIQNNILCSGDCTGSLQANISGGTLPYSYSWSSGFNNGSQNTNLCAGSYSLVISDYHGCDTSFNWTITEPTPMVISTSSTNSTCGYCNASASVTANGGTTPYAFTWSTGAITPTVSASLCAGTHFVTVVDGNGCLEQSQVDILNEASPTIDSLIFNDPNCFGSPTGSGTVFASGGATFGAYSYAWSPSTGNQSSQTAVAIAAGYHCVTVTDVNNCPASICGPMSQPSQVIAVPDGDTTICYGQEAIIWGSASGGAQPYTINWSTVPPLSGIGPHYVEPTATQQYCFNVTDANGCNSVNQCVLVQVNPQLGITTSQGVNVCEGDEANLWVAVDGGDAGNYTVTWYEDYLFGPLITTTTFSNDTSYADFIPQDSSWYFIRLEDGCSAPVYDSILVGVVIPENIQVVIPESFGCAPLEVAVQVISSEGVVFNYDFDCDGSFDVNSNSNVGTYIYEEDGVYDVCVSVINSFGCVSSAAQLNAVTVWPTPSAFFTADNSTVSIFNPSITFDDLSSGNTINAWYFGEGDTISGPNNGPIDNQQSQSNYGSYDLVTHIFSDTGAYEVSLVASNSYGCRDTFSLDVKVVEEFSVYVPNTITPDGDDLNDVFYVYGSGLVEENFSLSIFDRWGLLIFESHRLNTGWDGRYNGELVQQDAYIWKVHVFNENGEEFNMIGHVNVLR